MSQSSVHHAFCTHDKTLTQSLFSVVVLPSLFLSLRRYVSVAKKKSPPASSLHFFSGVAHRRNSNVFGYFVLLQKQHVSSCPSVFCANEWFGEVNHLQPEVYWLSIVKTMKMMTATPSRMARQLSSIDRRPYFRAPAMSPVWSTDLDTLAYHSA